MLTAVASNQACLEPCFDCSLSIGGISLSLGSTCCAVTLGRELQAFSSEWVPADIEISAEVADLRPFERKPSFDSGSVWSLYRDGERFVFEFTSPVLGRNPYKRLWVDEDFGTGRIILNSKIVCDSAAVPLEYPADELLFTNYLARHRLGVEVHGCGMIDREYGGFLFVGHSGAGKSTTTRIWKAARDPEILSDDRIILRIHDSELWMYGTPWHGEAAFASPGMAKLNSIFILQHGRQNQVREMRPAEAASELFARSFPPFHSAQGLEQTIEFLSRVVHAVSCYEFQFVPDESAVNSALAFHG
jgi:hypothetical protein